MQVGALRLIHLVPKLVTDEDTTVVMRILVTIRRMTILRVTGNLVEQPMER